MDFPQHQRPNISRLETYRSEIVAMRSSNWPFLKIAAWLDEHHQITVSKEAVRQFCRIRGIDRNQSVQKPSFTTASKGDLKQTGEKFDFDDSLPILTRKNT